MKNPEVTYSLDLESQEKQATQEQLDFLKANIEFLRAELKAMGYDFLFVRIQTQRMVN